MASLPVFSKLSLNTFLLSTPSPSASIVTWYTQLIYSLQDAFSEFHQREDRISNVATKVVHLGEQLESTNNRRVRGMEAQSLMHHLTEFQNKAKPSMPVFTDPSRVRAVGPDIFFRCGSAQYALLYMYVCRNWRLLI